jgi:hypothetical protein
VTGSRGAFEATEPGVYVVEPEPYAWFDPAARAVRYATAQAVRVTVNERARPLWSPPESVAALAKAMVRSPAIDSSGYPDWNGALAEARRVAEAEGATTRERVALAALVLLVDSGSERDRAGAYAELKRAGRSAFRQRGLGEALAALDESYGNHGDDGDVLPPFEYPGAAGLAFLAAAAIAAIVRRRAARLGTALPVVLAVVGAVMMSFAALSAAEDARPRFVSLGGVSRSVPSADAEGSAMAAGRTGRVLESAGGWLFVELDGGAACWLSAGDAVVY